MPNFACENPSTKSPCLSAPLKKENYDEYLECSTLVAKWYTVSHTPWWTNKRLTVVDSEFRTRGFRFDRYVKHMHRIVFTVYDTRWFCFYFDLTKTTARKQSKTFFFNKRARKLREWCLNHLSHLVLYRGLCDKQQNWVKWASFWLNFECDFNFVLFWIQVSSGQHPFSRSAFRKFSMVRIVLVQLKRGTIHLCAYFF